jgi:hypothetical protein
MPYDLTQAEREIRASLEAADLARADAVRANQLDIHFANAMKAMDEARVQFVLAGMKMENEKIDRNTVLAAVGQAIGSMWGNGLHYALGARERLILNAWVKTGLEGQIGAPAAEKTIAAVLAPEAEPVDLETAKTEGSA